MIADALRKIEADLRALVANATDEHPIDTHSVHIVAVQISAQAEMIERGIFEERAA